MQYTQKEYVHNRSNFFEGNCIHHYLIIRVVSVLAESFVEFERRKHEEGSIGDERYPNYFRCYLFVFY